MQINITSETDRFNLSEVKEDFINDCCFGEDFSEWLTSELSKKGAEADIICMEDFGWANTAKLKDSNYLVCVSGHSDDVQGNPNYGTWYVMLEKHRTLKEKLFGKNKISKNDEICNLVIQILTDNGFNNIQVENA